MTASVPTVAAMVRKLPTRTILLVLAGIRAVVEVGAIFLAPALYDNHFVVLVLLRPTKEMLLAGGFLVRRGDVSLVSLLLAAVPLMIVGVWLFYWLGRAWSDEITSGSGLPRWAERLLPPKRVKAMAKVLKKRGTAVVFLGRLAVFPSTVVAAAAGASGMAPKRFLVADGLGGLVSIIEVVGAGYLLGQAYERGGAWITAVGVLILVGFLVALGRWLRGQSGKGT